MGVSRFLSGDAGGRGSGEDSGPGMGTDGRSRDTTRAWQQAKQVLRFLSHESP